MSTRSAEEGRTENPAGAASRKDQSAAAPQKESEGTPPTVLPVERPSPPKRYKKRTKEVVRRNYLEKGPVCRSALRKDTKKLLQNEVLRERTSPTKRLKEKRRNNSNESALRKDSPP
jgi:hypothetical protein